MEGKRIRIKKEKELESHCRLLSDRPSPQGIGCAAHWRGTQVRLVMRIILIMLMGMTLTAGIQVLLVMLIIFSYLSNDGWVKKATNTRYSQSSQVFAWWWWRWWQWRWWCGNQASASPTWITRHSPPLFPFMIILGTVHRAGLTILRQKYW